jgi:hypothetical protein
MTTPNIFPSVTIFRSETSVTIDVILTFTFKVTNKIRSSDSYIELNIARDQLILADNT